MNILKTARRRSLIDARGNLDHIEYWKMTDGTEQIHRVNKGQQLLTINCGKIARKVCFYHGHTIN